MTLRDQCKPCPWRDMKWMEDNFPAMVRRAEQGVANPVCHTRCGPCDGPSHAGYPQIEKVA